MRLCTHNILACNVKACVETASRTTTGAINFPLKIRISEGGIVHTPSEFNPALIAHLIPKLHWPALRTTAAELGIAELPEAVPEGFAEDEGFLKSVHDLIRDLHIMEGALVCPNCERAYPIHKGIPNMVLAEDEL